MPFLRRGGLPPLIRIRLAAAFCAGLVLGLLLVQSMPHEHRDIDADGSDCAVCHAALDGNTAIAPTAGVAVTGPEAARSPLFPVIDHPVREFDRLIPSNRGPPYSS